MLKKLSQIGNLNKKQKTLIIIIAIFIVALTSFFLTNYKNLRIKPSDRITNINFDINEVKQTGTISFNFNAKYARKIIMKFNSTKSFEVHYNGEYANDFGNLKSGSIYDFCYSDLGVCGIKLDTKIGNMQINIENIDQLADLNIEKIYIDNTVYFNWNVFFVYAIMVGIILIFILNYNYFINNKHKLLFIMCFSIGILNIITTHNMTTIACDDETHFNRANSIVRDSDLISISDYYMINRNVFYTTLDTFEEKEKLADFLDEKTNKYYDIYSYKTNLLNTDSITYIPVGLTMKLLDTFNVSKSIQYYSARIIQLLIYCIVVSIAVKIIPVKKTLLMIVSMFPQSIFLASSFSYDPTVSAFLILSFAIFIKEYKEKDKLLSKKSAIMFVLVTLFGVFPKAIYAPMILSMLLLPKSKFKNDKQCKYFKLLIIGFFMISVFTFVLPMIATTGAYSDPRGGDTSLIRQTKSIIYSPIVFIKMFVKSAIYTMPSSLVSPGTLSTLSYYGSIGFDCFYMMFAVAVVLSMVFDNEIKLFDKKNKLIIIISLILINCAIWGSMYMIFTPVGSDYIAGVQPRYFIPIVLPSLFIISDFKLNNSFKKNTIMNICLLLCFIGNVLIINELIVKVFCI